MGPRGQFLRARTDEEWIRNQRRHVWSELVRRRRWPSPSLPVSRPASVPALLPPFAGNRLSHLLELRICLLLFVVDWHLEVSACCGVELASHWENLLFVCSFWICVIFGLLVSAILSLKTGYLVGIRAVLGLKTEYLSENRGFDGETLDYEELMLFKLA